MSSRGFDAVDYFCGMLRERDAEELLKYDERIMGILGNEIERIGEK